MLQYFETLQDVNGNALAGATCTVTNYVGGALSSIYASNGTSLPIASSVVTADVTGQVSFWVPDGSYTLTYKFNGTTYKVKSPVQMIDPLSFTAGTDSGAANAYVITDARFPANLYVGLKFEFKAANTNTGSSTLNLNGTGPQSILQPGGSGLGASQIIAGGLYRVEWDGSEWQLFGSNSPPVYAITSAEATAAATFGVTINTTLPYGSWRRYGADPTGVADSAPALNTCIACNADCFDDYPGGGNYILNSSVTVVGPGSVGRYPITIRGQAPYIGNGIGGTRLTLQTIAGTGAAHLQFTAFCTCVRIEKIGFQWQSNVGGGQYGIHATVDIRPFTFDQCSFINSVASPNMTAIQLDGGGTYVGEGDITRCYIAGVKNGVSMAGNCTSVRVHHNAFYGNSLGTNGILLSSTVNGPEISGNTIEGWTNGVNSAAVNVRQGFNYFEGNTTDIVWSAVAPFSSSIADRNVSSSSQNIPAANNSTANALLGGSYGNSIDSANLTAYRGFDELGLAANVGYQTTLTTTPTANGGGSLSGVTFSVSSYSRVGGTLYWNFELSATLTGAATNAIQIPIPTGIFPVVSGVNPVQVLNNGSNAIGLAYWSSAAAQINVAPGPNTSSNWTAGAIQINGQVAIRIVS
jgi:hypothetical protein